ncbi:MAG: response regulator [Nitrospiria bacterium]
MKKESIPILLAEDNPTDVEIIRRSLQKNHISNPIHIASDGREALDYLHLPHNRPGVLILDIHLPKINGVEVLKEAMRLDPETVVVMLTGHPSLGTAIRSLRREGAFDYLQKSKDDLLDLAETVRLALEKRAHRFQTHLLVTSEDGKRMINMTKVREAFGLSKREVDVLKCLCRGDTNKEMAERLFISNLTIKGHLKNIYRKMAVHNRATLISKILSRFLLPSNEGAPP